MNIEANLAEYLAARSPTDRYASFDYCFNYFQTAFEKDQIPGLAEGLGMQTSCLQLGFYLASWGMLRGSTFLLQRSIKHLAPVIEAIAKSPRQIWVVDANDYSNVVRELILDVGHRIRASFPESASETLVTKIMLGVFGCVPALDTNFTGGFRLAQGVRVATLSQASLVNIGRFYSDHAEVIERHRVTTLDFETGRSTDRRYSRAKVIDMIFFVEGGR